MHLKSVGHGNVWQAKGKGKKKDAEKNKKESIVKFREVCVLYCRRSL